MVFKNLYIVLKLTRACNLDCSYCYESKNEGSHITEAMLMRCLDEITAISRDSLIVLHGGEPMSFSRPLLKKFFLYGERKQKEGKKIAFNIQTNGMIMDKEWIDIIKQHDISLGISIDGPEFLHDRNRLTRNGKGSHTAVLKNINAAGNAGIKKNCLCVLTKDSVENTGAVFDFFRSLAVDNVDFLPCMMEKNRKNGLKNLTLSPEEYAEFIIRYHELWKNNGCNYSVRSFNDYRDVLAGGNAQTCYFMYPKICGREVISIDTGGDVYPCDSFAGIEEMRMGNIEDDGLEKIYASKKSRDFYEAANAIPKECTSCVLLKYCFGGCLYHRYFLSQNFSSKSFYCEAYKKIFRYFKKHQ